MLFIRLLLTVIFLLCPWLVQAQTQAKPLQVVASFSVLADIAQTIGKEHVLVHSLLKAEDDPHGWQPTAGDLQLFSTAQIFIINGLNFEPWVAKLTQAAHYQGTILTASDGIALLYDKRQLPDPHVWHSLNNGIIYARNITEAFKKLDPAHADDYEKNAQIYIKGLQEQHQHIIQAVLSLPESNRHFITSHDALGYFAKDYGLTITPISGLDNNPDISPQKLAGMINLIKQQHIKAAFFEHNNSSSLIQQLQAETGIIMGAPLYVDGLARQGPAANYQGMVSTNAQTILTALQ
ncbi:MAG: metal ABC transporter solute-binding protein, Zn/Mn family [Alphaproteobacteria bacterium]